MTSGPGAWRITRLDVHDLRAWHRAVVTVPNGLVVMSGPNGAGKTSLVEAAVMAAVGQSPRTNQVSELVRHGAPALFVRGVFEGPDCDVTRIREIGYQPRIGRRMSEDGVAARGLAGWRRPGAILVFVPEELRSIKGPPGARRRGIDRVLEATTPGFSQALTEYQTALTQRNAVMRRVKQGVQGVSTEHAAPWETQLVQAADVIIRARRAVQESINRGFPHWTRQLGGPDGAHIAWEHSPSGLSDVPEEQWAEAFREYLSDNRHRDAAAGMTLAGPHRDDVWVGWDTHDVRRLGSQGEQRTAALALVLAYRDILTAETARPILLLDDVLSELDPNRRDALLDAVALGGQSILTTADTAHAQAARAQTTTWIRVPEDIDAAA